MLSRCLYASDNRYENYGGRGITFDPRWRSFLLFLEDIGPMPGPNYSLEREDVNGNYCKENCKWIPENEQKYNKQNTIWVTFNERRWCLAEFCEMFNLDYKKAWRRHKQGWTPFELVHGKRL